jgi:multidrug efflux pump subunit AcrA (membrane-fusion protein)
MKKIKLIKILAGFFALMLLFTFLSRAADSVNVAQVETKTAQNQVITHEVTGTGKVMGTRERAVFTQEGQKVEQVYVQEGQNVKKGDALLKFSVKYLKKTIKEKQDAIDVLQGKINDLISAESVNQQKRHNEFSDAQENYNSAVSSGNYSVQAAQNEAAIARQKLQDIFCSFPVRISCGQKHRYCCIISDLHIIIDSQKINTENNQPHSQSTGFP